MKIIIIGVGGLGSFLVPEIMESIETGQLPSDTEITIADDDIIEFNQIKPMQNFNLNDIGRNKAEVLRDNYMIQMLQYQSVALVKGRITKKSELKGYDLIISCCDNFPTRKMIIEYCHEEDKQFMDLRATGRTIFGMVKAKNIKDNMKFVEEEDKKEYSCQDKEDLEKGWIQLGHKIIAMKGMQMILNISRGHDCRTFNEVI